MDAINRYGQKHGVSVVPDPQGAAESINEVADLRSGDMLKETVCRQVKIENGRRGDVTLIRRGALDSIEKKLFVACTVSFQQPTPKGHGKPGVLTVEVCARDVQTADEACQQLEDIVIHEQTLELTDRIDFLVIERLIDSGELEVIPDDTSCYWDGTRSFVVHALAMDSAREAVARVQGHLKSHRPSAVEAWEALSNIQLEFLKRKRLEWLTNRMDDLNVMFSFTERSVLLGGSKDDIQTAKDEIRTELSKCIAHNVKINLDALRSYRQEYDDTILELEWKYDTIVFLPQSLTEPGGGMEYMAGDEAAERETKSLLDDLLYKPPSMEESGRLPSMSRRLFSSFYRTPQSPLPKACAHLPSITTKTIRVDKPGHRALLQVKIKPSLADYARSKKVEIWSEQLLETGRLSVAGTSSDVNSFAGQVDKWIAEWPESESIIFDVNGLSVTELLDDTDGLAKISDDNKVYIIPSRTFPLPDDSEQASIALTTFLDDEDDDDHNSPSPDNVRPESVTICVASRRDKNIDQAVTEIKKILKQDFVKETVELTERRTPLLDAKLRAIARRMMVEINPLEEGDDGVSLGKKYIGYEPIVIRGTQTRVDRTVRLVEKLLKSAKSRRKRNAFKPPSPRSWEPQIEGKVLYDVDPGSSEFKNGEAVVQKEMPAYNVVRHQRNQNRHQWQRFCFEEEQLRKKYGDTLPNVRQSWFGSAETSPSQLVSSEFGLDPRIPDGTYDKGLYTAHDLNYLFNTGLTHVVNRGTEQELHIVCRVLVLTGREIEISNDSDNAKSLVEPEDTSAWSPETGHPKYDSIKGFTMRGEFPMHITKHMYRAYITDVFTLKKKQGAAVNTTSATW